MNDRYDVAIIGGGASGFFSACQLIKQKPDAKIVILEKSQKTLSKVRISGGGRCNVTHDAAYNSDLIKNYPNGRSFLKRVFKSFSVKDTIYWFEDHNVPLKIEEDGRMFPTSNSSESIIKVLNANSIDKGIELVTSFDVVSIVPNKEGVLIRSRKDVEIQCSHLIIASGGYPKESQFSWIKDLGHQINPPVPSLFTFNVPVGGLDHLQGLSVKQANVKIVGESLSYDGPLLITHWGISGPSVLKLSAWGARILHKKSYDFSILINWVGTEATESTILQQLEAYQQSHPKRSIHSNALFDLPSRLWVELMNRAEISSELNYQDIGRKSLNKMLEVLFRLPLKVTGKTTYKEEFVTSGGVLLDEIDQSSMQSKLVPNIYFTGEVLDIDGITGGFNFQAAWSTAYLAAKSISKQL